MENIYWENTQKARCTVLIFREEKRLQAKMANDKVSHFIFDK